MYANVYLIELSIGLSLSLLERNRSVDLENAWDKHSKKGRVVRLIQG